MYSSYRKSAVNNTVRMFHFWDEMGKLTLVAGCLTFQKSKSITPSLTGWLRSAAEKLVRVEAVVRLGLHDHLFRCSVSGAVPLL